MFWWHDTWGWGPGLGMGILMLLFWAAVIWAIVALVRGVGSRGQAPRTPQDILAERFAAGEIDEEEYRARRAVLDDRAGHRYRAER